MLVFGYKIHLIMQYSAMRKDFVLLLTVSFLSYALEIALIFIGWSFPSQTSIHFHPRSTLGYSTVMLIRFLFKKHVGDSWEYFCYHIAQFICVTKTCDSSPLGIIYKDLHRFSPITARSFRSS